MKGIRHLPAGILILMLIAATAAMSLGWFLARQKREEVVERNHRALLDFSDRFDSEVESLQRNLDRTLLVFCRSLEPGMSDRSVIALGETYAGVRQVSVVNAGRLGRGFTVESSLDFNDPFPIPRIAKEGNGEIGLNRLKPGVTYFWAMDRKDVSYFVSRQSGKNGRVVVLGIDQNEILMTVEDWLRKWTIEKGGALVESDWSYRLLSPRGVNLVEQKAGLESADTVYPIQSLMGSWQLQAWNERREIVEYRESVLITAGLIAVGFVLAGLIGFYVLRRSVKVAMQRVSFVNQVSHELRTPLTNMMLNLDLAKDSAEGNSIAIRRLGRMGEELGRLQRLLENVLTFSVRNQEGSMQMNPGLDLRRVVQDALKTMEPMLLRQKIRPVVELEEGLRVRADEDRLAQVLGNLISNVLKYGGDGSELLIEGNRRERKVVLRISDSGPGVRKGERRRVFKPFVRLSARLNEGASGSGLGLAIARDLARAMGGDLICVDRSDGESGACFELSLGEGASEAEILPFRMKTS